MSGKPGGFSHRVRRARPETGGGREDAIACALVLPGPPSSAIAASVLLAASLILIAVVTFHLVLGTIVLASNLVVAAWGALVYRGRARPNQAFAQTLALSHASTVGQSVIGLLLLSSGNRAPQELHYVYGIVSPVLILFAYSSRTDDARRNIGVFALVAFLVLLVAARAYMTGRGIG